MTNWIRVAAWSGIFIFIMGVIGIVIDSIISLSFNSPLLIIIGLIAIGFSILFNFGFFVIGKRYKISLVKIFSIYFIILIVLFFLLSRLLLASPESVKIFHGIGELEKKVQKLNETYNGIENIPESILKEEINPEIEVFVKNLLKIFLIFYIGTILLYGVPSIFFGIGLMKLRKNVKHANVAGILEIVGGATLFILIGIFILVVAFVFEIIILFNESKKK